MKFKQNDSKALFIIATSFALLSTPTYADWGVNIDVNNTPLHYKDAKTKKNDNDVQAALGLQYRGDKFNIDNDSISYELTHTDKYAIEAFGTFKNQGFDAKNNKTFKGMKERKTSIDIGGRLIANTELIGPIVFDATKDVSASKAFEAKIKVGGIAPHAPHWTGKRNITIAPVASLRYQSKKVVDYYYGVKNTEATASRKAYKAKSAITPFIGVEAQANITPKFSIDVGLGVAKLAKSIKNSPLTTNRKYLPSANINFTYWF